LRRGIVIFILLLIVEYLVVPETGRGEQGPETCSAGVNAFWLAGGVILEFLSLFCYGLLTQALLPPGSHNPGLSVLFRIDLAAAAIRPTSSRPARWAAPGSATSCSPTRASRAGTPR